MPNHAQGSPVKQFACHGQKGNQHFALEWTTGIDKNPVMLKHVPSGTCVEGDIVQMRVVVAPCDPGNVAQHWRWDTVQWRRAKAHEKRLNIVP